MLCCGVPCGTPPTQSLANWTALPLTQPFHHHNKRTMGHFYDLLLLAFFALPAFPWLPLTAFCEPSPLDWVKWLIAIFIMYVL